MGRHGMNAKDATCLFVYYAGKIEGDGLDVRLDSIPKGIAEIHAAEQMGYSFGDAKIPSVDDVARVCS